MKDDGTASRTARSVAARRLDYARAEAPYGDPAADEALARDVAAGLQPSPGRMHEYIRARTAFFDRVVVRAIGSGIRQVVVGAAGYDGRSLRYAKPGVRWFEVDHPDTQADKLERLRRLGIDAPRVRFIAADFRADPVADRLRAAGLNPARPALFLFEGIAVYLDNEVNESVLRQFREVTAAGGRLAISVSLTADARGQDARGQDSRARFRASVAERGEPVRSVLEPDEAIALLGRAGWAVPDPGATGDPEADARSRRLRAAGLLVAEAAPLPVSDWGGAGVTAGTGSTSFSAERTGPAPAAPRATSRAMDLGESVAPGDNGAGRHPVGGTGDGGGRQGGRALVSELKAEAEPAEVGLDAERLARIDRRLARYVDAGQLAGWLVTVSRHGRLAHVSCYGARDAEAGLPVEPDTVWRLYSMTKPITSVAAMMLYEEGAFELTDPVSRFIPSFDGVRVYAGGSDLRPVTVPAIEPVRIWHLLTHTAGLTYGFHRVHPSDALHRAAGFDMSKPPRIDLAAACDIWAGIPLLFQPGTEWAYSVATDVLGRVIEVASGLRLDEFFAARILGPLGMTDTGFYATAEQLPRLAALYACGPGPGFTAVRADEADNAREAPVLLSGGGGLVSTAADYDRFLQMLLARPGSPAGELDGAALLSPRTVGYMARNHLPGGADLVTFGRPLHAEVPFYGTGFGLGFAVVIDPVPGRVVRSAGELSWGGAASTAFWIDPAEELTVMLFTQLMPSSAHPLRSQLRQLVYQALL